VQFLFVGGSNNGRSSLRIANTFSLKIVQQFVCCFILDGLLLGAK
jgi:hypothetical protein